MSKTLLVARTELRAMLNESSATFWSDAILNTWLNEGCKDLARRTESLILPTTIAVTAGTQDYLAPTNLIRAHRMEFTPDSQSSIYPMEPKTAAEMDQYWGIRQTSSRAYPQFWTERGSPPTLSFRVWPVPSVNGTINLTYYRHSTDAAIDGTSLDVVEGWENLAVNYAEYKAKRKDNDPTWKDAKAEYEEGLATMMEKIQTFNDQSGTIVVGGGLGISSWLYNFEG